MLTDAMPYLRSTLTAIAHKLRLSGEDLAQGIYIYILYLYFHIKFIGPKQRKQVQKEHLLCSAIVE